MRTGLPFDGPSRTLLTQESATFARDTTMQKEVYAIVKRNAKMIGAVILTACVVLSFRFGELDVEVTTQVFSFSLKVR